MYAGSNYELYLQSLAGFLIIIFIFVPILKWGFTSKSHREHKNLKKSLKRDLLRLKRK
jgi:succinate dehydrogenase/fumarate reductase cytochrome b subunit